MVVGGEIQFIGAYDRTKDYVLETAVTEFFLGFLTKSVVEGDIKGV